MSIQKQIQKNRLKRSLSNDDVCGLCAHTEPRKPGSLEVFCQKKKKLMSVIEFALYLPEQGSCFKLSECGIKWKK
jgi:hypothetical protein